jgi:hypothetical protein
MLCLPTARSLPIKSERESSARPVPKATHGIGYAAKSKPTTAFVTGDGSSRQLPILATLPFLELVIVIPIATPCYSVALGI